MCLSPITIKDSRGIRHVPCGSCSECLRARQLDWTIRTLFEWEYTVNELEYKPYFVTLTYDDNHLHFEDFNGVSTPVLSYSDWHKALHYLLVRKHYKADSYRFLLCGEYGALRHRPHYHCLLFVKDEQFVKDLQTYWYKTFCPKAKKLVDSGKYALGEVGVNVTAITVNAESAQKIARYISKYVSKGSFDFTKSKENRTFYKDYPSRVFTSRGYGMQRLGVYKEQLSKIKVRKYLDNKYNPLYLRQVMNIMRVCLGVDLRDPNKPFYAPLPKLYFEKLLPKNFLNETDIDFSKESGLFTRPRVVKEVPSTFKAVSTKTAMDYLRAEDLRIEDLRKCRGIKSDWSIDYASNEFSDFILQQIRSRGLSDATRSLRFGLQTESWLFAQVDFQ